MKAVKVVTAAQGDAFAEELSQRAWDTGVEWEACDEACVLFWPEDDTYAQERYQVLQDDICERALQGAKAAIAKAFVGAAREVIARERQRQK